MGNGDIAHITRGYQTDYKRLYASNPEDAFVVPVTLAPGFGVIPQGTPLSKVTATGANKGKYVPYNPTTIASTTKGTGQTFVVAEPLASTSGIFVSLQDSYRFAVGDELILADNNTKTSSVVDLGAITAIDRTTYGHMAVISTTNGATTDFTLAQGANVFFKAGADNSNTWSDCAGILDVAVDTGVGENAEGGLGSMIVKNAMLYAGMCPNVDAAAIADLSIKSVGQFYIL